MRKAADKYGKALTKYGYSEFGEVYVRKRGLGGRFVPHTARVPEEVLNRETVNRLYTGGTQEQLSGLVHLDARHYSPAKTKFVQPDPYSLTELSLPEEARHTLVKAAGLTLEGLLADPAQQLSNSYVSNNPLKWTDPLGLCAGPDAARRSVSRRSYRHTAPIQNYHISSPYSERRVNPVTRIVESHKAIDFAPRNNPPNTYGHNVKATQGGKVAKVVSDRKKGDARSNRITISYDNGRYGSYNHVKAGVKVGEKVNQGQKIGVTDNSGTTTNSHVHYMGFDESGRNVKSNRLVPLNQLTENFEKHMKKLVILVAIIFISKAYFAINANTEKISHDDEKKIDRFVENLFFQIQKKNNELIINLHDPQGVLYEDGRITREEIRESFLQKNLYYDIFFSIPDQVKLFKRCQVWTMTTVTHYLKVNKDDFIYRIEYENGFYTVIFSDIETKHQDGKCYLRLPHLTLIKRENELFIKFLFFFYYQDLIDALDS